MSSNNAEDLAKKLRAIAKQYQVYQGWRELAINCTIYLLNTYTIGEVKTFIDSVAEVLDLKLSIHDQPVQLPKFLDGKHMQSWIDEKKLELNALECNLQGTTEDLLSRKVSASLMRSQILKVVKISEPLKNTLQLLEIAEADPLNLQPQTMDSIGKISEKFTDMKQVLDMKFIDALMTRQASLLELINMMKFSKNSSGKENSLEQKLAFYSNLKESLKNKNIDIGDLQATLMKKTKALEDAQGIFQWAEESLNGIKAILKIDMKNLIDDKDGILLEASNWRTQASTRLLKLEDIPDLEKDTLDMVKKHLKEVAELSNQITTNIHENTDQTKEAQLKAFHQKEELIANSLQNILLALQGIKIEGSTLSAIEKASRNVEKILNDCERLQKEKEEYVSLGQAIKDVHNSGGSIKDICTKWERVTNLLRDQKAKSQSLIQMWNQSESLKKSFEDDMIQFSKKFPDDSQVPIESKEQLQQMQDDYKHSIDILRKMRYNFEMFFKCEKQLIHEMQTVPSFDTSQLKKDLANIQQRYAELCTVQKERLFVISKLSSTWDAISKEMTILDDLCSQVQNPSCNLTKCIEDIANLCEHTSKVIDSMETDILVKAKFNFMPIGLPQIKSRIEFCRKECSSNNDELAKLTQNLDKHLSSVEFQMAQQYVDCKSHTNVLTNLKETFDEIKLFQDEVKAMGSGRLIKPFCNNFLRKCLDKAKELFSIIKPIDGLDNMSNEAQDEMPLRGNVLMLKEIILKEKEMHESYWNLLDDQTCQSWFDQTIEKLEEVAALFDDIKNVQADQVDEMLPEHLPDSWASIIRGLIHKFKAYIEEVEAQKEENTALGKTLINIETEILNDMNEITDFRMKYGKLSSLCWRLPRTTELPAQSDFFETKMTLIFTSIVQIMQADLQGMMGNITNEFSWLKSWMHSSIEEMCLGEPFTDVTQVVQCLDQTLVLLNSCGYAMKCAENLKAWTEVMSTIKIELRSNVSKKNEWLQSIRKAENELNELFDKMLTSKPIQPEDVVMLSTVDEMNSKLEKQMNDSRAFLAQMRSLEEKINEMVASLDSVTDGANLKDQHQRLLMKMKTIQDLSISLNLQNVPGHLQELMEGLKTDVEEKMAAFELVEKIAVRTEELKELGIGDEDFEDLARDLLEDLNDIQVKLSEQQNEQIQACLEEVTSLLEDFEAKESLNADMLEIAQLHEELTLWLKDVEDSLQKSLELKSSLDDKRKQLEEYHEIHSDIEAHEKLVTVVFEKTSKLMTQTNDFSLSTYLTSIQALFETIKFKSAKLIQQMNECIQDQEDYEDRLINFTDFLTDQAHYLKEILSCRSSDAGFDVSGAINCLLQKIEEGNGMIVDLEDSLADVQNSTSEDGKSVLEVEFRQIYIMWTKHLKQINDLKGSLVRF